MCAAEAPRAVRSENNCGTHRWHGSASTVQVAEQVSENSCAPCSVSLRFQSSHRERLPGIPRAFPSEHIWHPLSEHTWHPLGVIMSDIQNITPETASDEFSTEVGDEDLEAISGGENLI